MKYVIFPTRRVHTRWQKHSTYCRRWSSVSGHNYGLAFEKLQTPLSLSSSSALHTVLILCMLWLTRISILEDPLHCPKRHSIIWLNVYQRTQQTWKSAQERKRPKYKALRIKWMYYLLNSLVADINYHNVKEDIKIKRN